MRGCSCVSYVYVFYMCSLTPRSIRTQHTHTQDTGIAVPIQICSPLSPLSPMDMFHDLVRDGTNGKVCARVRACVCMWVWVKQRENTILHSLTTRTHTHTHSNKTLHISHTRPHEHGNANAHTHTCTHTHTLWYKRSSKWRRTLLYMLRTPVMAA